jgi:hypothetical protein
MRLRDHLRPKIRVTRLTCGEALLESVRGELAARALADPNRCFGYFPGLIGSQEIDSDLPRCKQFSQAAPRSIVEDRRLDFNFLRLSLVEQVGAAPFHLDTDSATALTGTAGALAGREVWRFLANLSENVRRLAYLDLDPDSLRLSGDGGYIRYRGPIPRGSGRTLDIPPRKGTLVYGALFCSSKVLHTGRDRDEGHFVAAYGIG